MNTDLWIKTYNPFYWWMLWASGVQEICYNIRALEIYCNELNKRQNDFDDRLNRQGI
jgi:hypothetical protein